MFNYKSTLARNPMENAIKVLDYKILSNKKILESKGIFITPKITLLIGFYNNSKLFDMLFASIEKQTFRDFEVIILDDGSKPDVVQHIHKYMRTTNLLIQHMWQEDDGWRKPEMLNKSLYSTSSEYLILIDQDCILHPEFIREHYENKEPNTVLAGRRAELSPFLTKLISPQKIKKYFIQKNYWWMFFFMFHRKDNQWDKGVYIKNKFLRNFYNRKKRALVGCNISFYKSDIIKLNGFDMSHIRSCGSEDSDIEFRLKLDGVKIKPLCHSAVQYHMYHPVRQSNEALPEHFQNNIKNKIKMAAIGYKDITPVEIEYL